MLSIKLKEKSHKRVGKVVGYLCLIGYLVAMGTASVDMIGNYIAANAILKDYSVAQATVTLKEVTETKRKKNRTTETYHFSYTFDVDGTQYEGAFSTSKGNSHQYLDEPEITVAYSNTDPNKFDRMSYLERHDSLLGELGRLALGFVLFGLLALIVYALMMHKVFVNKDAKDEEAPAAA